MGAAPTYPSPIGCESEGGSAREGRHSGPQPKKGSLTAWHNNYSLLDLEIIIVANIANNNMILKVINNIAP